MAWSRKMGETCWRRLPDIAKEINEMGERDVGAAS